MTVLIGRTSGPHGAAARPNQGEQSGGNDLGTAAWSYIRHGCRHAGPADICGVGPGQSQLKGPHRLNSFNVMGMRFLGFWAPHLPGFRTTDPYACPLLSASLLACMPGITTTASGKWLNIKMSVLVWQRARSMRLFFFQGQYSPCYLVRVGAESR